MKALVQKISGILHTANVPMPTAHTAPPTTSEYLNGEGLHLTYDRERMKEVGSQVSHLLYHYENQNAHNIK